MDRLSAHLDRGWDLLGQGDTRGARTSARRALEIDRESPEAHNLLGQAAAREGDADEAIEHYKQAYSLDDGYVDPMLSAAEVLIHPLQRFEDAIALCDEVLEFADLKEERADALLLKFDALQAMGQDAAARALLDDLPEGPYEAPFTGYLVGRAWFEAGEFDRALPLLVAAVGAEPDNADAHYYLAMTRDRLRDWKGATLSFLEARELDLGVPPPPWSPSKDLFHRSVERALGGLEPDVAQAIEGALVLVADVPGMEVVADGVDPRASVLVDGVGPDGSEAVEEGPRSFVRIFVYQRNVERNCGALEQIEDEISTQVTDEVRHLLHGPLPDDALGGPSGEPN